MSRFIHKLARYFHNRYVESEDLLKRSRAQLGQGSAFYEETRIFNFQNKPQCITIGKNSHIRGELLVFANGGKISIGDESFVGRNSYIWSAESVQIGNHVLISHHVNIMDTNSHETDAKERAETFRKIITSGHPVEKGNIKTAAVIIKDHAWINFNAVILKGITIGEGAIVAAGSVVTKDVADYTFVAGNPAVVIKQLR